MRTFAWFLGLIVAGFAAIAAFTYPAWRLLHPYFGFPFHRLGERIGMLALLGGFSLIAKRLGLNDRASLGYGIPRGRFFAEMALALGLGILSMAVIVGVMTALHLVEAHAVDGAGMAKLILSSALSAFAVAFIEETFLRGAMLSGIERESGATAAVLLTALVYSATHFFASFHVPPDQVTPGSGLDLVVGTLYAFAHPLAVADAFFCLFGVGIVLGTLRISTGNIAACIGMHAGWVWVMLVAHALSRPIPAAPLGFLLSRFDGFVGWLVLAWTGVLGLGLRRFYATRAQC